MHEKEKWQYEEAKVWRRKNEDATLADTASCQLVGTINNADEEKAFFLII